MLEGQSPLPSAVQQGCRHGHRTAGHCRCPGAGRRKRKAPAADRTRGAHHRRRRGRLRRYRHQSALRLSRGGARRGRGARSHHHVGRTRRPVADPLVADHRRHAQVRHLPHPRRQQRRGRHARPDGAGATRVGSGRGVRRSPRHHRRRAVLRRRGDHAGAVGAVGGRGPRDCRSASRRLRHSTVGLHPARAVSGSVAGHGAGGDVLRAGHGRLVRW